MTPDLNAAPPCCFTGTEMPDPDWWTALWPDPEALLRRVGIRPGERVVDLCCGYGA